MNYNHVAIVGQIKKYPEFKKTSTGLDYCRFYLEADASYTDKNGQIVFKTTSIPVVIWGKICQEAQEKMGPNTNMLVSGSLKSDSYKDKNGQSHMTLTLNGSNILYLTESTDLKTTAHDPMKDTVNISDELPF